ncbi:MAG: PIN domain-containing protein [Gallionella sp.]|nr:MAG: PIN domain-containing protein [Gallionella sp.]
MKGVLVDSNVILDIFLNDPIWADWSEATLEKYSQHTPLYINSIIYSEVSIGFIKIEDLESSIVKSGFQMLEIPKEALFLAGKVFLQYKKQKGVRRTPLPDFYIESQAAVLYLDLITRDASRLCISPASRKSIYCHVTSDEKYFAQKW